jgi:hypothetical protein
MQTAGLAHYHAWAFATTRQLGAAMELLSAHLRWLGLVAGSASADEAAGHFFRVSESAKAFVLKAARAVNARKPLDAAAMFDDMALGWERGMTTLSSLRTYV